MGPMPKYLILRAFEHFEANVFLKTEILFQRKSSTNSEPVNIRDQALGESFLVS